ncbi:phenazine biosynthesis protein PhzF [Klebsiella pneumoniae]|uniref:Phenazine biosynthesis protein PhzF n=1 Tax=Klebsiella pneumoniae TaxID=573 RepID=A0A377TX54_KLEPN|nr:phenazine biosynthesis protein PhzF [Klebsiella pneumoniae]
MQEIQFYLVDAFSDKNFGGNAAAVCPLSEWLADDVLLKMAQQHNQSETASLSVPTRAMSCAGLPHSLRSISAATRPSPLRTLFSNISTILRRRFSLAPVLVVSCGSPVMATG